MEVTLLGTGDTTGTPTVGCDCDTCERARELGVERSRFSVHVRSEGGESLLVDASPDFRSQFLTQGVDLPDAVVITHVHFDHLDGLGNAYRLVPYGESIPVYAAGEVDPATGESVADTVRSRFDYLDRIDVRDVAPFEPTSMAGLEVTLVPVEHPPLASYGLAIADPETGGRLAITGDTSYAVPEASREALSGADLLLADAIVPAALCDRHPRGGAHHDEDGVPRTFGTKHMTREGALDLADELGADRTRLVHAAHFYPAEEAFAEPLAVDGETYSL
ncbi:MAG: MBL fold metallo-hydrolase [Actinobacteria bacterium]|nr:MBL fold metallo-hydrolase [Actinomycetota bacterium]NIU65979.1 MBL fold metallo-hydrolase [Actinomycetota bacterium]NIW27770.1 MBL fold metallo-hydrolase [Actinomycetota bacterium]NIX20283.1 MBL fold metallo-hydrolase [Actinomycetota bacterium]